MTAVAKPQKPSRRQRERPKLTKEELTTAGRKLRQGDATLIARVGGYALVDSMTPKERRDKATRAARARWAKESAA